MPGRTHLLRGTWIYCNWGGRVTVGMRGHPPLHAGTPTGTSAHAWGGTHSSALGIGSLGVNTHQQACADPTRQDGRTLLSHPTQRPTRGRLSRTSRCLLAVARTSQAQAQSSYGRGGATWGCGAGSRRAGGSGLAAAGQALRRVQLHRLAPPHLALLPVGVGLQPLEHRQALRQALGGREQHVVVEEGAQDGPHQGSDPEDR